MTGRAYLLGAAMLAGFNAGAAAAAPPVPTPHTLEQAAPEAPAILPLRERALVQDTWLAQRLDRIVPGLMRDNQVDMWVLIAREYLEDPVVGTMLDAESLHARRRTILVFFDPGGGRPVERLTVSRYGMGDLFKAGLGPGEGAGPVEAAGQADRRTQSEADRGQQLGAEPVRRRPHPEPV